MKGVPNKEWLMLFFIASLFISGCANKSLVGGFDQPLTNAGIERKDKISTCKNSDSDKTLEGLYSRFKCDYESSEKDPYDREKAQKMLKSGYALIRGSCIEFFNIMGKQQQKQDIAKDALSLGSNIITGILSATDASSGTTAGSALMFETLESSFDIRQMHVLFNPDTRAVENLTLKALELYEQETMNRLAGATSFDYVGAYRKLLDYQKECSVHNIKSLVNDSISRGELEVVVSDKGQELKDILQKEEVSDIRRAISKELDVPSISDDELFSLWWVFEGGSSGSDGAICPRLEKFEICKDKEVRPLSDIETEGPIRTALANLPISLRAEFNEQIRRERQRIESGKQDKGAGETESSTEASTHSDLGEEERRMVKPASLQLRDSSDFTNSINIRVK